MNPWHQGKKTYLVAAAIAAVAVAQKLGYLDADSAQMILTLLGAGGAATLAAKINRTNF